jgi:DNA polymerase-3 subunit gamma/tau
MTQKNHITLARQYRPQSLSDIVGQDILVTTIRNALALDRLPQAILLTGTRGIGKTTTARLIAKYLNCTELQSGNQSDCCNICESCIAINSCSHPDVLEFDAASKTSVNDIREIIDNIFYSPIKSKNKFYIIDEVHMLSNSAFNALLKTLEEPPQHVRFILATTEENKVPLTIISRCLQFRLKPMKYQIISRRCSEILSKEGYAAEENVVDMIAKAGNGSMRDALSILDGAIAFCADDSKKLLQSNVVELLGYKHHEAISTAFDLLCLGDLNGCLIKVRELYDFGVDPITMATDILNIAHKATIRNVSGEFTNIEIGFLLRAWHILSDTVMQMKSSGEQMMQLEMSLIKLAHLSTSDLPEKILEDTEDENSLTEPNNIRQQKEATNIMAILIAKSNEELPGVQKIKFLNPYSDFLTSKETLRTFNHLRILLAFLLDIGEAVLYHRLSSVVKIVALDNQIQHIVVDCKRNNDTIEQVREALNIVTGAKWTISFEINPNAMTYSEFLTILDKQCEKALLQTDIVQYILSSFNDFKVEKITLNNTNIN